MNTFSNRKLLVVGGTRVLSGEFEISFFMVMHACYQAMAFICFDGG